MALPTSLTPLQNLVEVYDELHGLHIRVWTDTDGSLVYQAVGELPNFDSTKKIPIKAPLNTSVYNYTSGALTLQNIYAIPTSAKIKGSALYIRLHNTSNIQSDPTKRVPGDTLKGIYKDTINFSVSPVDYFSWTFEGSDPSAHNPELAALEVTDSPAIDPIPVGGIRCVQYQRNVDGTIKLDSNGVPLLAQGSSTGAKIGSLVLQFKSDYFGAGNHAWGSFDQAARPFDMYLANNNIYFYPGTVNQQVPSQMFSQFPYTNSQSVFCHVDITTNGSAVTGSTMNVDQAAPAPISVTANSAPATFSILIGMVVQGTLYKIWQGGNIICTPLQAFLQNVTSPVAGTSPTIKWYTWQVAQGS